MARAARVPDMEVGPRRNLALRQPAKQSSDHGDYPASNAVDGIGKCESYKLKVMSLEPSLNLE
jgi:hypothetical protein